MNGLRIDKLIFFFLIIFFVSILFIYFAKRLFRKWDVLGLEDSLSINNLYIFPGVQAEETKK